MTKSKIQTPVVNTASERVSAVLNMVLNFDRIGRLLFKTKLRDKDVCVLLDSGSRESFAPENEALCLPLVISYNNRLVDIKYIDITGKIEIEFLIEDTVFFRDSVNSQTQQANVDIN